MITHSRWNTRRLRGNLATVHMVGRTEEMKQLEKAWTDPKGRVVSVEGPGGAGKTAIIWEFLRRLRILDNVPPADTVYGWTFLNQGQQDFQTTAIGFVRDALKHFGIPQDANRPFTELAEALRQRRCVLILDGIETLQDPQNEGGYLMEHKNEEGLKSFLHEVCDNQLSSGGLVLLTSKERVKEVDPHAGNTDVVPLGGLNRQDGAALLLELGVRGTQKECEKATQDLRGNPLLLVVLAGFLEVNGLTIFDRDSFKLPTEGAYGEWVKRVIAAYAGQLEGNERAFLRLLGLFGRPMNQRDLDALENHTAVQAVHFLRTDQTTVEQKSKLLARLHDLHLLNGVKLGGVWQEWDTHPAVRQHFAEEFRSEYPEQWQEAHGRLFDQYRSYRKEDTPEPDQMLELFGAVRHGCLANRHREAYELYRFGIAHDFEGYDTEKSAFASEALIALSAFFEDANYAKAIGDLNEYQRAWVLARVSYCLHSLGELARAIIPRQASNHIYRDLLGSKYAKVNYEAARDAAYGSEVLSQIQLRLGQLGKAYDSAYAAVELAVASAQDEAEAKKDPVWERDYPKAPVPAWLRLCSTETALGRVLHKQGLMKRAREIFRNAADRHDKECPRDREYAHCTGEFESVLHSEPGVWWSLLELDTAETSVALNQLLTLVERMKTWSGNTGSNATDPIKGLHNLVHGMVLSELADSACESTIRRRPQEPLQDALRELTRAVLWMEESRKYHFLCDVLLARTRAYRLLSRFDEAHEDLDSVLEISQRCEMRLTQVDAWILRSHLHLDDRSSRDIKAALECAKRVDHLFEKTRYPAAVPPLRLLEARLTWFRGRRTDAALEIARASLEQFPIARLNRELSRYEGGEWEL